MHRSLCVSRFAIRDTTSAGGDHCSPDRAIDELCAPTDGGDDGWACTPSRHELLEVLSGNATFPHNIYDRITPKQS